MNNEIVLLRRIEELEKLIMREPEVNGIVITGAMAYRTTNLSVANATWTTLSFAAEYFDYYPSGLSEMWASGTPGRITIRVAGIYHIKAYGRFAANATGYRGIRISKNETEILRDFKANISATYDIPMNLSHVALLAASDYIQADVWQNCGGALDFINPFWLSVVKQN